VQALSSVPNMAADVTANARANTDTARGNVDGTRI